MKRFLKFTFIAVAIVSFAFFIYKIGDKYNIGILNEGIECNILTKGVEDSKGIAISEEGSIYIAFKDYIKEIDSDGKEKVIYKNKDIAIEELAYKEGKLYFISDSRLIELTIKDVRCRELINNIPLAGNEIDRKILITTNGVYLSIGSVTNSGIAEGENFEKSPVDLVLSGVNINNTAPFKKVGEIGEEKELIKKSAIGNGSIYKVDLESGALKLYAYGIRGITGFDVNSENKLMAIYSGMKNEGVRAVNRDMDYIYQVEEGQWYGFPDFSGGDNISSPRFKGEGSISPLLNDHPQKVPLGPRYQHTSVDSLRELAIDKDGLIFSKDSLVMWDKKGNVISVLDDKNSCKEVLKLNEKSFVEDIVYNGNEFIILDSGIGCVYNIKAKEGFLGFNLPIIVWVFVFTLCLSILLIIIYKLNKKE